MPNYDLGRATGEVVIKTDTRGIKKGDKDLGSFEKTVQNLQRVIDRFDRVLDRLEDQLDAVAHAANKADRALDDLDGGFVAVHKSSSRAAKSTGDFNSELADTIANMKRAYTVARPLYRAYDHIKSSLDAFGNANGIRDYATAINRATMFTYALRRASSALGGQIIGVNRAYGELTDRQSKLVSVAGKLTAVAGGFAVFNRLGPKLWETAKGFSAAQKAIGKFDDGLAKVIFNATHAEGRTQKLSQSILDLAKNAEKGRHSIARLYGTAEQVSNSFDKIGRGAVGMVIGLKVAQQGIQKLRQQFSFLGNRWAQMAIAGLAGALALIGPAAEIAAKALTIVSNAANLLWNAVKQLSGGLLAVPGIFATILGAVLPVTVAFKRLSTLFEDVFKAKDAEELAEAIKALPEHLRPLGERLSKVKKTLEEVSDAAVNSFLGKDAIKEIDVLESALKGPIIKNLQLINNAARQFRQQLISTMTAGENITGLNEIFQSSRKFIDNMRNALDPFIAGMRDLAVVGSQFFADWTSGAERLAQRFADWTAEARKAGELRKYMDDALQGAKDLVKGTYDLIRALGKLLTLFATDTGENALSRYADAMERFNHWVDKSKADGVLRRIGDAVKGMGFERLESLMETLRDLKVPFLELYQAVEPFSRAVSEAFKDTFIPLLKVATQILEVFVEALSGLEPAIGWILGAVAGLKLIGALVGPIAQAGKVVAGLALSAGGLMKILQSGVVMSFASALDRILPGASKATDGLIAMESAVDKAKNKINGFIRVAGGIAAAIYGIWAGMDAAQSQIDDFNKTLDEGKKATAEYKDALRDAFMSDNGLVGKNVFDTVTTQMSDMRAQLEKEASQVPDWIDNLQETWFGDGKEFGAGMGPFSWRQGQDFNDMQKAAQDAERAKKKFDELGLSSADLAVVVTGSDSAFASFAQTIRETGENGNEAAAALEEQRAMYKAIQEDFASASEGSVELVNAITAIGDAGSDTTSKLSALNAALKALGFDKSDQYEAAFAFSEAIRKLGDEAANAVDASAPLEGIFGPNGVLATSGPAATNAQNLYQVVKEATDAFKEQAATTGDVSGAWATLQSQLGKTAAAFQTDIGNIQGLVANLTGNDYVVSLLLSVDGEDKVQAQIAAILLQYEKGGPGAEIKIPLTPDVDKAQVQAALDAAFGAGKAFVGEQTLTISGANITPQAIAELQSVIPGLKVPGGPAPKPAEVAVAPTPAAPAPGQAPAGQQAEPPKVAPPPADTAALDAANKKVQELEATIKALNEQKTRVEVDTTKLDEIKPKLDEIKKVVDEFGTKNVEFTIIAKGYDETVAVVNRVKDSVTQLLAEVDRIPAKFQAAFTAAIAAVNNFKTQFDSVMNNLANNAGAQGSAFVSAFAAGMDSNSAAIDAANRMAEAIKARFHQSPPKKGPLSAHGDAAKYAGGAFVDSYATGMNGNSAGVAAANNFAGGIAGATQGAYDIGRLLGVFNDIFSIGGKFVEIFSQISDAIFNTMKFIADPLGKGTIFGQKFYGRDPNVSDRDLQRRREDEAQSAASSAAGSRGARPGEGYTTDDALLANVPKGTYLDGKGDADLTKGLADCSSAVEDLVAIMDGRSTGGRSMSTGNAAEKLAEWGFIQGEGQIGDMRVAFNPSHMQATLPGGTPFNWGSSEAAARGGVGGTGADDPALTNRWYRPVDKEMRDALQEEAEQNGKILEHGLSDGAVGPDMSELTDQQKKMVENGSVSLQTEEQMLNALLDGDPNLDRAVKTLSDQNATTDDIYKALPVIDQAIESQTGLDTAQSRQMVSQLESVRNDAMSSQGIAEVNPIDQAMGIAGNAANVAKDVFASIESVMQSVGSAKEITDTLVRGVENSEDVMKTIDNVQQFITTAAQIAQAVSSGLGVAAGLAAAGGADPSGGGAAAAGALAGASQIASLVSAGLSTINGVIDLAQEVYRIGGKYFGQFLGFLTGGAGGQLMGDVRFLLDQTDGSLKTWSRDNPEDKRVFDNPFQRGGINEPSPRIGEINVYGGPGQDPRDMTNEMMFAVSAASSGAGFQE